MCARRSGWVRLAVTVPVQEGITVGTVQASAERVVAAPPERVYALLADYREGRPKVLPDAYEGYRVEEGGTGEGTVVAYTLNAAKRQRPYRIAVTEPQPGRELHEEDTTSSWAQTVTVTPEGSGSSRVRIACSWQGANGVGGFFERTFAPKGVGRLYEEILDRLEQEVTA
jgi:uncharacterized protein YndB with AHSA1/START domain